ncbi:DUF5956 family protein [Actinotalea sp. C106]|uniref:DUF5956 family protein n=1 Tax=Actinotalea sp. C106 TaxID=2908644 RepID=UPI002027AF24|nr:DUF5956 family protein [Actinotalea sp. C106]
MSDRWAEIIRTPPVAAAEWVALPENGWGAIIAYRVGPGRTRPHDFPQERRLVTEVCTDTDGTARRRTLAMTPKDFADIVESVNSYLVDVGLPPAPFTWWEVVPPDGMTGDAFLKHLEDASAERVTATSGVEVARQYAAVLTDEIESIYAQGDVRA